MPIIPDSAYFRTTSSNTDRFPYHDGKGIPPEKTTVYVRDDAYGECTVRPLDSQTTRNRRSEEDHRPNRSTDLALIWEPSADKVIGDPTNTSNCHEDSLFSGSRLCISPSSKHDQLTSSLRYHGAWLRKLRNSEYMGTVRNAVGKERISDSF